MTEKQEQSLNEIEPIIADDPQYEERRKKAKKNKKNRVVKASSFLLPMSIGGDAPKEPIVVPNWVQSSDVNSLQNTVSFIQKNPRNSHRSKRNDRNQAPRKESNRPHSNFKKEKDSIKKISTLSSNITKTLPHYPPSTFSLKKENVNENFESFLTYYDNFMKDIQYCIIETDTNEESKLIVKVPNTFSDNDHSRKYTVLTSTKILSDAYLILFNCFLFLFSSPSFQNYINYHLEQKFADFLFNYITLFICPQKDSFLLLNTIENDIDILKKMLKYSSTYPSPVQQHHPLYCLVTPSISTDYQRYLVQYFSILLARLYIMKDVSSSKEHSEEQKPSFSEASQYLYSAIPINPLNPLPRSYIAELSSLKESWFDSIYNYFLSLDIGSGFEAREKLGSLFEKARQELVNLEALKKKKKTLREIPNHALKLMTLRVLNCTGVLFTKIGIDNFVVVLDKINSSFVQLLRKVPTHEVTLPSVLLPRIVALSILSIFNSISPLGPELKSNVIIQTTRIENTSFSVITPSAFLLLLYVIKILIKVLLENPSAYMSLFLPSFYLFSLYIYTYPSILDCPDIPYDYLLPLFAQFYRLLPPNPQVPLVYQHKTNRSLGPYCHQENDIFDETTNLHKIDIRSSSYIQSVASSLPTELVELIGVNHFQHMIYNSLPETSCTPDDLRLTIIYKCQEILIFKEFLEIRSDHKVYSLKESYDIIEDPQFEQVDEPISSEEKKLPSISEEKSKVFNVNSSQFPPALSSQNKLNRSKSLTTEEYKQIRSKKNQSHYKPLIVIDAPNVCVKYGQNEVFRSEGLQVVIDYYQQLGHQVVSFIPDYYIQPKEVAKKQRLVEKGLEMRANGKRRKIQIPDDIALLKQYITQNILVTTPSQDYDDSYCIEYAQQHDGCIVTNDMYRDYLNTFEDEEYGLVQRWLKTHIISYTFVKDTFVPNPDFHYPRPLQAPTTSDSSDYEDDTTSDSSDYDTTSDSSDYDDTTSDSSEDDDTTTSDSSEDDDTTRHSFIPRRRGVNESDSFSSLSNSDSD